MTTRQNLIEAGEAIRKSVADIMADKELTGAQRLEKLKAVEEDKKAYDAEVESANLVDSIKKGLPEEAASAAELKQKQAEDFGAGSNPYVTDFNPGRKRAQLAMALMKSAELKNAVDSVSGMVKKSFNHEFELSLKDATAAGNLMGEGLYGSTGPTAAGQNPFLPGAFGPGIMPTWIPGIVEQRFYGLTVADLFSSIPTTSPNLSYLVEATANFQAGAVAEGGLYPFSSGTFSRVYEQIGKIANAMEFSDEVLRDAPQLYSFLQSRLIEGIQRQEEVQLLAGGGVPGVNGLLNRSSGFTIGAGMSGLTATNVQIPAASTAGVGAVAATIATLTYGRKIQGTGTTGTAPTGQQIAEGILEGALDIQLGLFLNPNAIVINPVDFRTIRLAKDANNQYFGGSFFGRDYGYPGSESVDPFPGGQTLWNMRVVQTPAMPAGSILVGCFDPGVTQVARREGISMQMTNTNGSNFVNGEVTLRAEERLGLMVYRPKAFQLIQLVNAA
ncbi:phage major capsid protein [Nocardia aobensis]|uniref:Phage major capsid protein n=1 Tax=Nocardia aobensis TaxID=257277 RepID=A0ABW6P5V9_9NOCA